MAMKKRKIKEQPVREEPVKQEPVEKPWFRFWPEGVRKHIDFPEVPLHKPPRGGIQEIPRTDCDNLF